MEAIHSLDAVFKLVSTFGLPGLVLVLWFFSDKAHEKTLKQYREDVVEHRRMYEDGLAEVRRMYENNVELVRSYAKVADGFQDQIVLNTQMLTRLCDAVNGNQYCPQVRLRKQAEGRQA